MRAAAVLLLLGLAVAGCTPLPVEAPPAPPPPRPASILPEPGAPPDPELSAYYRKVEETHLARGQMRTDLGDKDTPFDTQDVVEAFLKVALYTEYGKAQNGQLVSRAVPFKLSRWTQPVRITLLAGNGLPAEMVAGDRRAVRAFAARLARASGHPVSMTPEGGNMLVLLVSEQDRQSLGPWLRSLKPKLEEATIQKLLYPERGEYCLVATSADDATGTYQRAVAIIRAELPQLSRLACYHEEIAQSLGLANDSPTARPSIFNDDDEFALLTRMDEILLRILYDPRLQPGMTEAEARPIVETIAAEIMGGST